MFTADEKMGDHNVRLALLTDMTKITVCRQVLQDQIVVTSLVPGNLDFGRKWHNGVQVLFKVLAVVSGINLQVFQDNGSVCL